MTATNASEYDDLDREQLVERLALAEDVCRMYAWSTSDAQTARGKAAYMLWCRWHDVAGSDSTDPRNYPHLSDERVADLAAERDRIRARALAAITRQEPTP